jgi:hypothetical protein
MKYQHVKVSWSRAVSKRRWGMQQPVKGCCASCNLPAHIGVPDPNEASEAVYCQRCADEVGLACCYVCGQPFHKEPDVLYAVFCCIPCLTTKALLK